MKRKSKQQIEKPVKPVVNQKFHFEFKNSAQKMAWAAFQQHDIVFMTGSAGTGKTILSVAYAVQQILQKKKRRIILTRPVVESGENLGFLPGDVQEKLNPYMLPLYDSFKKLLGDSGMQKEMVMSSVEIAPLAYLRGRTFCDAVCILDEAQNTTYSQLKLFLTRFDENSKIIINGDPKQTDLYCDGRIPFVEVSERLEKVQGIAFVDFGPEHIVRHPLIKQILASLEA